jgi:hypothetical protein
VQMCIACVRRMWGKPSDLTIDETRNLQAPDSQGSTSQGRLRTAVLSNRLRDAARIALPNLLSSGFAKVHHLKTLEAVFIRTSVFGCPKCRLKERFRFVPRHGLVTLGMNQDQLEPRASAYSLYQYRNRRSRVRLASSCKE